MEELGSKNYNPKWDDVRKYCPRASLGWAIGGDAVKCIEIYVFKTISIMKIFLKF